MAKFDVTALLAPISEDLPCGEDMDASGGLFQIEQEAKGVPERQMGDRIEPAQPPNWRSIESQALELCTKTKDLRVFNHLIRSQLNLNDLAAMQAALELLQGTLENYWDSLYPQLDPDDDLDPTLRVNLLMELCDPESVLRPISYVPLAESRAVGRFSLRDINLASGKLTPISGSEEIPEMATIQAAFDDMEVEAIGAQAECVARAIENVNAIERFVTDQVGNSNAPNLAELRNLLRDVNKCLSEQFVRLGGANELGAIGEGQDGMLDGTSQTGRPGSAGALASIGSRGDVVRALDLICDYYSRSEPSSPVPLLLLRAKKLVNMDFMAIMESIAPEGLDKVKVIAGLDKSG